MTNGELVVRFDRWLMLQRYSPITRDMYRRAMREYVKFLGKLYDRNGAVRGLRHAYIPAKRRMSYQEAWAHFARVGERSKPQRPLGSRPLCHGAIQRAVQRVGARAGVVVNPREFPSHVRYALAG